MVDFTVKLKNLKLVADMVGKEVYIVYCVISVFNVFIRESVHTVKEVRFLPVRGRLVCVVYFVISV